MSPFAAGRYPASSAVEPPYPPDRPATTSTGLSVRRPPRRSSVPRGRRRCLFSPRPLTEVCVDERLDVAVEHGVRVPHLRPRAVILHHAIGMEDVRPDLVAEAELLLPLGELGHLLVLLLALELVETPLQDLHRHRLVLVLGALVLAGDDDAAREVCQPDRGVGLVHVLAAGAAR